MTSLGSEGVFQPSWLGFRVLEGFRGLPRVLAGGLGLKSLSVAHNHGLDLVIVQVTWTMGNPSLQVAASHVSKLRQNTMA